VDIENIRQFVLYSSEKSITKKQMIECIFAFVFLSFIGAIYGFIAGGIKAILSLFIVIATIVHATIIMILSNKKQMDFKTKFLFNGIISVFGAVIFFLLTLLFIQFLNTTVLFLVFIVGIYITIILVYFYITIQSVKNGVYGSKNEVQKKNAKIYSILGGTLGIYVARLFFHGVEQQIVLNIAIVCFFFLSIVFSFGTINFLKYHYTKKFELTEKS